MTGYTMKETITACITLVLVLSASLVIGISAIDLLSWGFRRFCGKYEERMRLEGEACAVKLAEAEREQEELKERERITDLFCGMSDRERNIFDLVKSGNGCGIWVSQKDAGVQTLLHKGLLERIGIETSWQDWEEDRARCILAEIPTRIKAVITSTELA